MKRWLKKNKFYFECLLVIVVGLLIVFGIKWAHTRGHMECAFERVPSLCASEIESDDG